MCGSEPVMLVLHSGRGGWRAAQQPMFGDGRFDGRFDALMATNQERGELGT